jgi:hypothetical protein
MQHLFTFEENQDLFLNWKARILANFHIFSTEELLKWEELIDFETLCANQGRKWTIDFLRTFEHRIPWNADIRVYKSEVTKELLREFSVQLMPMLKNPSYYRLNIYSDEVLNAYEEFKDIIRPEIAIIGRNTNYILKLELLRKHKDDPDFDWILISEYYRGQFTWDLFHKFREYWHMPSLGKNPEIMQLEDAFSEIGKYLDPSVFNRSRHGILFAIQYPDHPMINWKSISPSFRSFDFILQHPDFPYWDWKSICWNLNFENYQLLEPILKKINPTKHNSMYVNKSYRDIIPIIRKEQYRGQEIWNFFKNEIDLTHDQFTDLGQIVTLDTEEIQKQLDTELLLELDDKYFLRFWKKQGHYLSINFLEKNPKILNRLLNHERLLFEKLPYSTALHYPRLFKNLSSSTTLSELTWDIIKDTFRQMHLDTEKNPLGRLMTSKRNYYELMMDAHNNNLESIRLEELY